MGVGVGVTWGVGGMGLGAVMSASLGVGVDVGVGHHDEEQHVEHVGRLALLLCHSVMNGLAVSPQTQLLLRECWNKYRAGKLRLE